MCIFFTLCVQFSTGMQLFVSAEKLSSFVAQKLFGKIPSVLKGLLGMGVFGYRILHQSVAVTMQLIVEQVLIAIFLLPFFFFYSHIKNHLRQFRGFVIVPSVSFSPWSFMVTCILYVSVSVNRSVLQYTPFWCVGDRNILFSPQSLPILLL